MGVRVRVRVLVCVFSGKQLSLTLGKRMSNPSRSIIRS